MRMKIGHHPYLCQSLLLIVAVILLMAVEPVFGKNAFQLMDQETLTRVEKQFGSGANKRLMKWQNLIREDTSKTDMEKLTKVNLFFNKLEFISDPLHWNKKDYWATPVEFLASNGGDCEDFSLAKYFTLKAMGVAEKKLNLTYVKAIELNQAHMVLTYFKTPRAEPLVLDNLIDTIKPASQRTDLQPVYSFNGAGLWLAKQRGRGKLVGRSDRLKRWQELQERMLKDLNY